MKTHSKFILLLCLIFIPGISQAQILTRITKVESKSAGFYNFIGYIDSWDEDDKTPNPCFKKAPACFVAVSFGNGDKKGSLWPNYGIEIKNISDIETTGELGKIFKKKYPLPYRVEMEYSYPTDYKTACITLGWYETTGELKDGNILPGLMCRQAPDVNLTCSITGSPNLEHGNIVSGAEAFNLAETQIIITCNQNATLRAYVLGDAGSKYITLRDDGSLKALVEVGNAGDGNISAKIIVKKDIPRPSTLYSYLKSNGEVEPGPFHGSGTLILAVD